MTAQIINLNAARKIGLAARPSSVEKNWPFHVYHKNNMMKVAFETSITGATAEEAATRLKASLSNEYRIFPAWKGEENTH